MVWMSVSSCTARTKISAKPHGTPAMRFGSNPRRDVFMLAEPQRLEHRCFRLLRRVDFCTHRNTVADLASSSSGSAFCYTPPRTRLSRTGAEEGGVTWQLWQLYDRCLPRAAGSRRRHDVGRVRYKIVRA